MYRGRSTRAGGKEPGPEGLISFGMNPVGLGPQLEEDGGRPLEAEVAGGGRERRDGDRPSSGRRPGSTRGPTPSQIQTEVFLLPAANFAEKDGTFTNSARWLQWKWKALDPPGQAKADQEILGPHLPGRPRALPEGGRRPPRAGAERRLGLHQPRASRPLRGAEGDEREGPADLPDPKDQTKIAQARGTAARRLRPARGRRLDHVRQLAALRRLHRGREQRPAPQQRRPDGPRHVPRLGLLLARQPPDHVQPGIGRRRGQALGRDARRHPLERREVGGRRARHEGRRPAGDLRGLRHAPRRCGPALRSRASTTDRSRSTTRRSRRRSRTRCIRR